MHREDTALTAPGALEGRASLTYKRAAIKKAGTHTAVGKNAEMLITLYPQCQCETGQLLSGRLNQNDPGRQQCILG